VEESIVDTKSKQQQESIITMAILDNLPTSIMMEQDNNNNNNNSNNNHIAESSDDDDYDDVSCYASSDISLGSDDGCDEVEDMDGDVIMTDSLSAAADNDDENDTASSSTSSSRSSSMSNGYQPDLFEDDDDDTNMQYEDSLSLNVVITNRGTVMVEAKGSVPLQKAGHLTIMSRLEQSLPVSFVTNILLLANPTCIKELRFSQVALLGDDREFEEFALAIRTFSNLEELHLVDCSLLNDRGARPLDTLLIALASPAVVPAPTSSSSYTTEEPETIPIEVLPKLHLIELYAVDIDREPVGSFVTPSALSYLIHNKTSLTRLDCQDLTFQDEHIIEMAAALETNTTLRYLSLWGCTVGDRGMVALSSMLEKNTGVQHLDLSYNEIGDIGCTAVAKSLHVNKTLKALKLVRNEKFVAEGEGYEALLEMMKWNHNIEELLLTPSPEVDSDLGFYLFVNRHRYLLENDNITRRQLVDMLHSHRNDSTFLFHFLKAKPTLCNTNERKATTT